MDAVIDLKEPTEFSKVSFNTNVVKGDWIMGTAGVTVRYRTTDRTSGGNTRLSRLQGKDDKDGTFIAEISFDPVKPAMSKDYHQE
ncbi:MAG: hypothetical protein ACLR6J_01380 [Parabacteroides merdae]